VAGLRLEDQALLVSYAADMYRVCKARGLQRRLQFELTLQDVVDLLARTQGRCDLTGIAFSTERVGVRGLRPWMPSMDRRDASQGYTRSNCRVVCAAVNLALSDFGDTVLHRIAMALAARQISSSEAPDAQVGVN
jgi:hypothetical protein